ncbi:MAG TPA: phosphoribosylanthranilate isomerase [Armatimonadota bacterium]|nr:phosphoribosylanthranilate isomerase [Armatimonadota bacterium]
MLPRTRVKICGITNLDDALLAVELGADALGFIFFHESPRYISPIAVREIIDRLPPFVTPVAVVVNQSVAQVSEIMAMSGCQIAQLHGDEPPEFIERLAWPAIKGISIATVHDLALLSRYNQARAILLDSKVAGQYGGTGTTFDWQVARQAHTFGRPIILAGGLSPENVEEAMHIAEPDAIDVSSSIESSPGKKDPERMRRLFDVIRAVDEAKGATTNATVANTL